MFYPLSKFDGKMKTTDWSKLPHFPVPKEDGAKGESKWVNPATYYEELPIIMKEVPPLPGEQALYGWINSVWRLPPRTQRPSRRWWSHSSPPTANSSIRCSLFVTTAGPSATVGLASVNASQWGTDYLNRTAISKSSMYQNTPEETQYQFKEARQSGRTPERKQSIHDYLSERKAPAR